MSTPTPGSPGDDEPDEVKTPGAARRDSDMAERMKKAAEANRRSKVEKALGRAPKASVARFGVVVLLAVITLGMIVHTTNAGSRSEQASQQNLATIGDLQAKLADAGAAQSNVPDAASLKPAFDIAASKADELTTIQNQMAQLSFTGKDANDQLVKYNSLVTSASAYFSAGSMTGGSFLPQGQWYQPQQQGKDADGNPAWIRLPASSWTWKTIPTKSIDSKGNVVMVWTAQFTGGQSDGVLLAWVIGTFDSRRSEFFALSRGMTPEGYKRRGATTSSGTGYDNDNGTGTKIQAPPSDQDLLNEARAAAQSSSPASSTPPSGSPSSAPSSAAPSTPVPGSVAPSASADPSAPTADPGLGN